MKKVILSTAVAMVVAASAAVAADLKPAYKAAPAAAAPPSPWDIAFGAAVMSDYNFRGISQSNRRGAVTAYFEPRYNFTDWLQGYAGVGGYSIEFPNRAAAEIDFYGGIRPTFGKFAFDFGIWYYYYPDGQCFNTPTFGAECIAPLPNGNVAKSNASFIEYYGKLTYNFSDKLTAGVAVYYDPNWLNTGADGTYLSGTAKYVLPWTLPFLSGGTGMYISGELAHYWFGTTDSFYGIAGTQFAGGVPLPDYTTWNIGLGFTWKVFTLDLRYYDTDLSSGNCNVLTSDHTAVFNSGNISQINPGGLGSRWCGSSFIAKFSADLTYANLK
jgi:hypothetical protein